MNEVVDPGEKSLVREQKRTSSESIPARPKILLLTPYTGWNLGDGAIQDAAIHHLRKRFSNPQIQLVTLSPGITTKLHGLPSFPLTRDEWDHEAATERSTSSSEREENGTEASITGKLKKRLKHLSWLYPFLLRTYRPIRRLIKTFKAGPREMRHLLAAYQLLKKTNLLVISGGGQIDDYWGGAFGHPYALAKWASLARLAGVPVVFLSVGVCSLKSWLSRKFALRALRIATYRSYRDAGSKELLGDANFTHGDPVYPDLAFSHPRAGQLNLGRPNRDRRHLIVGVSPITYLSPHGWPEQDAGVYERYLQTLCEFTIQVLDAGHTVILFTSALQDGAAVRDLQARLLQSRPNSSWGVHLRQIEQTVVDRQLDEIGGMDVILASRLHGIILSHLLGKPVLAISYDRKVRVHMESMAQLRFCLDLHNFTVKQLNTGFADLVLESSIISAALSSKVNQSKEKLDQQYNHLVTLNDLSSSDIA